MKIYHVETKEDYDALMIELEENGCEWNSGAKPRNYNGFKRYGKDTYIYDEYGVISLSSGEYFKKYHSDETLVEYKAKGDNEMANKECNQCHKKWHQDSAKYCSWCGNKLVSEPKFKVGDYVVELDRFITKIEKNDDGMLKGCFYMPGNKHFSNIKDIISVSKARHATTEEIAEYEAALSFHKHGRKPFEVRQGDIISYNESDKFIVDYEDIEPEFETFDKEKFIRGDLTFLKTIEEVNEWIENK